MKKLTLFLCLALSLALLTGCAYLPTAGLTSVYGETAAAASAPAAAVAVAAEAPAATAAPASGLSIAGTVGTTASGSASGNDANTVTISRAEYERYKKLDMLLDMMDIVEENYYQDVDETALIQGAAAGMLEAVGDPYTFYYTPEAYTQLWEDDEGEYAGIGIMISGRYDTGICTVSRVFTNTPAERAGVHKGDILYRVGEELYVTADNLDEAVSIMRGTPGTTVDVTFLRNGEELTFTIERAIVNQNWVESCMLSDDVGLVTLYQFAGDCSDKFKAAADDLIAKGAKGIIIDLRDNPGGWVSDAVGIADYFLDAGVVCTTQYKSGYSFPYRTYDGKVDVEVVVLVNENSASSSEILTGCLHDRGVATVVGVTSYGKGIIQSVLGIGDDGSGMQLTVAEYVTPNGNHIHKIGITPDVEIALPEGDNGMYEHGDLSDPQLNKAFEVMNTKLGH